MQSRKSKGRRAQQVWRRNGKTCGNLRMNSHCLSQPPPPPPHTHTHIHTHTHTHTHTHIHTHTHTLLTNLRLCRLQLFFSVSQLVNQLKPLLSLLLEGGRPVGLHLRGQEREGGGKERGSKGLGEGGRERWKRGKRRKESEMATG